MSKTPDRLQAILDLDRLVHEPARLAVLSVLSGVEWAEFKMVESLTKLTKGNLSSHLAKLEEGGYVAIHKGYRGKVPQTTLAITKKGRDALEKYWEQLKQAAPRRT
ncbi:MAG TPA: transcriptional regulator [Holophagaceae bacterium]|jgi:DNA-binding transcriptional ArsR family regulator|nr:transcriptional regulator [Holophagaceae bacterium]